MLKKFLRTSVLTLGAGLCVLSTLQNESRAMAPDEDKPATVMTGIYIQYNDHNGVLRHKGIGQYFDSIRGGEKKTIKLPDERRLEQRIGELEQDIHKEGGTTIAYEFSMEAVSPFASGPGNIILYNTKDIKELAAQLQRPVKASINSKHLFVLDQE
ncbi:MAG: hypothetical protein K2X28_03255 [Alphaproteobacteria bacterium]|nr:hypothetical protein [Alphaproteobacteria bacterium]